MNNLSLGFIGIGLMGLSLVKRLSYLNYKIDAYDKNLKKLEPLKEISNIRLNQNVSEISKNNDIIILCLDKTESVKEVVFEKDGLVNNAHNDTILDLSTTLANETIDFSNQLNKKTGASWVDAPVSGGPDKAFEGNLAIMVGGDEKVVETVKPILEAISSKFTHFGVSGSGQIVKMINQIIVLNNYAILAEAASFAKAWNVDANKIPEALSDGHAGSNLLNDLFPRIVNRDFAPKGYASQILKDLQMVSKLANSKNTPTPMSSLTEQLFTILTESSKENLDGTSIVKLYDSKEII
jgi:3-hydroxyisobutyrate dehydrogenase